MGVAWRVAPLLLPVRVYVLVRVLPQKVEFSLNPCPTSSPRSQPLPPTNPTPSCFVSTGGFGCMIWMCRSHMSPGQCSTGHMGLIVHTLRA